MMRLELREIEISLGYIGPLGRYPTTIEGIATDFDNLRCWLEAWERALFDVARLRFGRHCRNLRVVNSSLCFHYINDRAIIIYSRGHTMNLPDRLPILPCILSSGIDIHFEQIGLQRVYRHQTFSWVNVRGVAYRVRWSVPETPALDHEVHGRRWLQVTVVGDRNPTLFQVSLQELPRLPAGSGRF
jgi:hypothetical protein